MAGRTCGSVAPFGGAGRTPPLACRYRHDTCALPTARTCPRSIQPSLLDRLPEFQVGRMDEVSNRERSRLSSGGTSSRTSIPSRLQPCLPATAALGLPFRNNNAQAKFGGPGGNGNAHTDNILWILVALEQQVAARPCAARRRGCSAAERKAKTRYKERTWSTRSDYLRLTALRRRMWRRGRRHHPSPSVAWGTDRHHARLSTATPREGDQVRAT